MSYAGIGRAAYGALLLAAPGALIRTASGEPAGRPSAAIARILGLRHLAQALLLDLRGTRVRLVLGATIDTAHALSMVGLAVLKSGSHRRPAALDAALASAMALDGLRRAHNN